MRKILALSLFAFFLFLGSSRAQKAVEEVSKGLHSGDVSVIAKNFDKLVDITIVSEQSTYSGSQAEMVLKNFFDRNSIKSFNVKHKGTAPSDNSVFLIGELNTKSGNHRVYLFFKQKENTYYLQELRIE